MQCVISRAPWITIFRWHLHWAPSKHWQERRIPKKPQSAEDCRLYRLGFNQPRRYGASMSVCDHAECEIRTFWIVCSLVSRLKESKLKRVYMLLLGSLNHVSALGCVWSTHWHLWNIFAPLVFSTHSLVSVLFQLLPLEEKINTKLAASGSPLQQVRPHTACTPPGCSSGGKPAVTRQ